MGVKLKSTFLIMLPAYTNISNTFEVILNSKHGTEKLRAKKPKIHKHQKPKHRKTKTSF